MSDDREPYTCAMIGQNLMARTLTGNIVPLLDRILLILLVVELLYTVQVSFREHGLIPEPFLLVGLIAAIRRVLVLTAEFAQIHDEAETVFKHFIIELVVLTVLIVALVSLSFFCESEEWRQSPNAQLSKRTHRSYYSQ